MLFQLSSNGACHCDAGWLILANVQRLAWQQWRAQITLLSLVSVCPGDFVVFLSMLQGCTWNIISSCIQVISFGFISRSSSESCFTPTNTSTLVLKSMLSPSFPFISFCLAALHHMIWVQINHNGLCESFFFQTQSTPPSVYYGHYIRFILYYLPCQFNQFNTEVWDLKILSKSGLKL